MTVDGVSEPHVSAILAPIFELLALPVLAYIGLRGSAWSVLSIHLTVIAPLSKSMGESVGSAVVVVGLSFGGQESQHPAPPASLPFSLFAGRPGGT